MPLPCHVTLAIDIAGLSRANAVRKCHVCAMLPVHSTGLHDAIEKLKQERRD